MDELKKKDVPLYRDGVVLETRLRERYFGTLNGGPDSEYQSVWDEDVVDPNHTKFGVESVNDVVRRTTRLVLQMEEKDPLEDDYVCILVAHGDVLQILQTGFEKMDGAQHRTLPHLETAVPRALCLKTTMTES